MATYNLDDLEVEETGKPFEFSFGEERDDKGKIVVAAEKFTIAPHYDPRVFRRFDKGDAAGALLMMLGEEQFDRLDAIDKPFDERHFIPLLEAWAKHSGTTVGEAAASSSSSNRTARRSRPTSKRSTASGSRS